MKSPINALSNPPIVQAGGYHLGDVDSRASEPGVVRPRTRDAQHVPAVPLRRPTITPKPFAPALAPRRSDGHPGLVAFFLMALIAGGGFAGWKYWWLPNHPAQRTVATVAPNSKSAATTTPATSHQPPATASLATGHQPPATAVASDSPLVALDRNADSVTAGVQGYDALVRSGRSGCDGLSQSLVAMEDAWTRYNVGKRKAGSLDGTRFTRDQQLYASVDTVERDFDRSGCTRP